jgi:hypothetical protein
MATIVPVDWLAFLLHIWEVPGYDVTLFMAFLRPYIEMA